MKGGNVIPPKGHETLEGLLAHFGIRGMKWGVRRANPSASIPASEDSVNAEASKAKIRTGGTKTLSNAELQNLVSRMNLEQQYGRMAPPTKTQAVKKFIAELMVSVGKQQATRIASEQAAKAIGSLLAKRK